MVSLLAYVWKHPIKLTEIRQTKSMCPMYMHSGNRTENAKQIQWKYSETRDRRERILISSLCKYFIQQIASRAYSDDERSTTSFSAYAGNFVKFVIS